MQIVFFDKLADFVQDKDNYDSLIHDTMNSLERGITFSCFKDEKKIEQYAKNLDDRNYLYRFNFDFDNSIGRFEWFFRYFLPEPESDSRIVDVLLDLTQHKATLNHNLDLTDYEQIVVETFKIRFYFNKEEYSNLNLVKASIMEMIEGIAQYIKDMNDDC